MHIDVPFRVAGHAARAILHVDEHPRNALIQWSRARLDHHVILWPQDRFDAFYDPLKAIELAAALLLDCEDEVYFG